MRDVRGGGGGSKGILPQESLKSRRSEMSFSPFFTNILKYKMSQFIAQFLYWRYILGDILGTLFHVLNSTRSDKFIKLIDVQLFEM